MSVSKSQQKAVHKYVKANYDRMELTVQKGRREEIKSHAAARGESVNGFITRSISEAIERDNGAEVAGKPVQPAGATQSAGGVSPLSPETLEAAKIGAEAAGEPLQLFIDLAIAERKQRYKAVRVTVQPQEAPQQTGGGSFPSSSFVPVQHVTEEEVEALLPSLLALMNQGESVANNKGRSKLSSMAGEYVRDAVAAGYTLDEIVVAMERAATEGFMGGWQALPDYCVKVYGKRRVRR